MVKRGLGKGLSALITDNVSEESQQKGVQMAKINEVEPNRKQPRKKFKEEALSELAESIRQYGVIQPLVVKKEEGYYEIIAGERRWRAARIAGMKELPVVIKGSSPQEALEISLIENIQREDLNPIEEAFAYKRLMEEFHLTQEEVASKVSKSRSAVANFLRLLNLDQRVQEMLMDEILTSGHARALLGLTDHDKQYEVAERIYDEDLTVRETERIVKDIINGKPDKKEKKQKELEPIYRDIEDRFKQILGTKVQISKGQKKGKIEIEYYSDEDLDRIYNLFQSIDQ